MQQFSSTSSPSKPHFLNKFSAYEQEFSTAGFPFFCCLNLEWYHLSCFWLALKLSSYLVIFHKLDPLNCFHLKVKLVKYLILIDLETFLVNHFDPNTRLSTYPVKVCHLPFHSNFQFLSIL
eukprot:NODE_368_length_8682_cov_0.309915.p6 type:complete len:121 gc:universal NODE_368_length_8682_cov_0.309915:2696-2334(-)